MSIAWKLALRNLSRNRRRNLATGVAVALGYAGLVLLAGYTLRVERYIRTSTVYLQHLGHVALFKPGGLDLRLVKPKRYGFDAGEQRTIAAVLEDEANVERWGRILDGSGLAGNGCRSVPFVARGVDLELDRALRDHPDVRRFTPELARPIRGEPLASARSPGPLLAAEGLARLLGKSKVLGELPPPGPPVALDCAAPGASEAIAADANVQLAGVTFDGSFNAIDGDVVGIYSTGQVDTDESALLTSLEVMQSLYDTDRVTHVAIYLRDAGEAGELAARLERTLAARGVEVSAYAYDDEALNPYYVGTRGFLLVMTGFLIAVVALVVVLSVLNSMTLTILERTREMGTLRSIGLTRRMVVGLYAREGLALTAISLAVGLALGLGVAAAVNAADIRFQPPGAPRTIQLLLTPDAATCAVLAAGMLLLCTAATWLATRRRARWTPVELNTAVVG
jgi:putative ABC transport system permease protein